MIEIREVFLKRFITEKVPYSELQQKIKELSLGFTGECGCITVFTFWAEIFFETLQKLSEDAGEFLSVGDNQLVFICCKPMSFKISRHFALEAVRICGFSFSAIIGKEVNCLEDMKESYEQVQEALKHLYKMDSGQVLSAGDILGKPENEPVLAETHNEILHRVKIRDHIGAEAALEKFMMAIRESTWTYNEASIRINSLALSLAEYAMLQGLYVDKGMYEKITMLPNLSSIKEYFRQYLNQLINESGRLSNKFSRQGIKAVEYIESHYMQPDISISQLTSLLSVSNSHFCAMFKGYTGTTFTDYLSKLRINKAQELLLTTDKKNYEIAAAVGFDDPSYFRLLFKKHTSCTPSEYRKRNRQSI